MKTKFRHLIVSSLILAITALSFTASALEVNGYHFFTDYASSRKFGSIEYSKIAHAGRRYGKEYPYLGLANNHKTHGEALIARVYAGTTNSGTLLCKDRVVYGNTGPNVLEIKSNYAIGKINSIYAARQKSGEVVHPTICYFN